MKRLITTIFAVASVSSLFGSVLKVTSSDDGGAGSLREAVQLAGSGDTLELNVTDTIRLDSVITINKNLVITKFGKGEDVISGQGATRVLHLNTGYSLAIHDVTICKGWMTNAAGIYSAGNLTLNNCVIKGNNAEIKGAGVYLASGTNLIIDCTFENNRNYNNTNFNTYIPYGGGLYNALGATTTVDRCNFDGNSCRSASWTVGGAIGNEGTLVLTNSTLVNNTLESTNSNYQCIGAAVGNLSGTLTVTHCTIMQNNIISGVNSGAGIAGWQSGPFNISNTIVYGNTYQGTTPSDIGVGQGSSKTSLGNNLIGSITQGFNTVSTDLISTDPLVEGYALNGGSTKNYTIKCTSPAHHAGNSSTVGTTSQNGIVRGSKTDIGAFAWSGTLPTVSATGQDATCPEASDASAAVSNVQLSYTYTWSNGASGISISNVTPGSYIVTATDGNQCTNTDTVVLSAPQKMMLSAVLTDDNGGGNGEIALTVNGGTGNKDFLWTPGNLTTQNLTGLVAGTYQVRVTDGNGCTIDSSFVISTLTHTSTSPVNNVRIYPNPARHFVNIETDENVMLEFLDASGRIIVTSTSKNVDLTGVPSGVYLLKLTFINDQIDPVTRKIYVRN